MLSIETDDVGLCWIIVNDMRFGPYTSLLEASMVFIMMVTDDIRERAGNNVFFLEGV